MTTINLGDQLRRIKEAVLNALQALPGTPGWDSSRTTARLSLEAALDLLMPLLIEPDSPALLSEPRVEIRLSPLSEGEFIVEQYQYAADGTAVVRPLRVAGSSVLIERRADGLTVSVGPASATPNDAREAISRLAKEGLRVSAAEVTAQGGIAGDDATLGRRSERVVIDPERLLWAVFFREGMRTSGMGTKDAELIADDATRRAVGTSEGAEKTERIRAMLRAYGADD